MEAGNKVVSNANLCVHTVESLSRQSLEALKQNYDTLMKLSVVRAEKKMSNTLVINVARELNELIKVMSRYCC